MVTFWCISFQSHMSDLYLYFYLYEFLSQTPYPCLYRCVLQYLLYLFFNLFAHISMYQVVGEPQVILPFPWIFLQGILAGNFLPHFFSPRRRRKTKAKREINKVPHLMPISETGTAPSPAKQFLKSISTLWSQLSVIFSF